MHFIGVDIGTSFLKGALLALDPPGLRAMRRLPVPEAAPGLPPLHHEIDTRELLAATRRLIDELLALAPGCAGIVLCGQMHGLVLMDGAGQPLTRAITWRDQRALEAHGAGGTLMGWLDARVSEAERARTGNELRPGLPITALAWLAARGALPDEVIPASLLDAVAAGLVGAPVPCEPTNAAAYGLLDLAGGDWHWEVIERLGLGSLRWPELQPFGPPLGDYRANAQAIPVYAPIGDQQAALLGAGLAEGELSLNIATGSQVSMLSAALAPGPYQERPYFEGRYLRTIPRIPAGRALDALLALLLELPRAQGLQLADPWDYVLAEAEAAGETDLELSMAFFAGALGEAGQIRNLHEGNMRVGHIFRAAFARMAADYAACARDIDPAAQARRLVFSGGLARRVGLLRELIGRAIPLPQRLSDHPEDTLLGLLALARFAAGATPTLLPPAP